MPFRFRNWTIYGLILLLFQQQIAVAQIGLQKTDSDANRGSWAAASYTDQQTNPSKQQQPPTAILPTAAFSPIETLPQPVVHSQEEPACALELCEAEQVWYDWHYFARGYYSNDQRLQWSGQEATFGAEGGLVGDVQHQCNDWLFRAKGELYINQPFDRNILLDTPERISYRKNFDIDPFEISELYLSIERGDFTLSLGKKRTPFGRTYFPLHQNNRMDAPFIRTESIAWRETGFFIQYQPSLLVFEAAVTNGSEERDTNSSKGLVSRVGIETENFAFGGSIKTHDGIGSDGQKMFNSHVGVDAMFRRGRFTLSAEAIYDKYGFRKPGFNPNTISWKRSLYYRDQNKAVDEPITGYGYYVNLGIEMDCATWIFNYGEFYPEQLGDPLHDVTTRRGYVKYVQHLSQYLDMYAMIMIENDVEQAQANMLRKGTNILFGFQFQH